MKKFALKAKVKKSIVKVEGVWLYFREGLPIKERIDVQLMQEMIVPEITLACKKMFFLLLFTVVVVITASNLSSLSINCR